VAAAFERAFVGALGARLRQPRRFVQVVVGPRQTGKSTGVRQAVDRAGLPVHAVTADAPSPPGPEWLAAQWDIARLRARDEPAILVLDEVQKVRGWSEVVKRHWDEDSAARLPLHVVLLGSAALLVQEGLSESLAGRFETLRSTHWSAAEMRAAFGWSLDRFVTYGGYPGTADLVDDPQRWAAYVRDSLIETTVSRDILALARVDKPALLRQLFHAVCEHSGQIVSFTKLLGQLHDAGNTTTLAHHLRLLEAAGLATGLQKYTAAAVRQRASSPKLLTLTTALVTAITPDAGVGAREDPRRWGRLVETAALAHLAASIQGTPAQLGYWRDGNREVDAVLWDGNRTVAIEVTGGEKRHTEAGLEAFARAHRVDRRIIVGAQGMPLADFLELAASDLLA
jgi:predicted AAA+ superfamily ATPase